MGGRATFLVNLMLLASSASVGLFACATRLRKDCCNGWRALDLNPLHPRSLFSVFPSICIGNGYSSHQCIPRIPQTHEQLNRLEVMSCIIERHFQRH
jgi:hypothetical protein